MSRLRQTGLVAVNVAVADRERLVAAARARGLLVEHGGVRVGGVWFHGVNANQL